MTHITSTEHVSFPSGHRVAITGRGWRHYDQKDVVIDWDDAANNRLARIAAFASVRAAEQSGWGVAR